MFRQRSLVEYMDRNTWPGNPGSEHAELGNATAPKWCRGSWRFQAVFHREDVFLLIYEKKEITLGSKERGYLPSGLCTG